MSRCHVIVRKVKSVLYYKCRLAKECAFLPQCCMTGRRRLLGLLWLTCLLAGALCLTLDQQHQSGSGQVVTLHHQQTILTLQMTDNGELTRCDTIEVNYADDERRRLAAIRRERPVTNVSLSHMLDTLRRCQQLDTVRRRRRPQGQAAELTKSGDHWDASMLLRGLVPGTKWCGLGDTAEGWNDLGTNAELDRCCRTHDLCPVKVKAYKRRYDLFNWGVYTKSHCACDQEFYRCLKASSAREADSVGRLFFDLLQPQCVQGRVCGPNEPADACLERQKAGEVAETGLKFFDQPRRYEAAPVTVSAGAGGGRGTTGGERGEVGELGELFDGGIETTQELIHVAGVGPQDGPVKPAPSYSGGGLSSFLRRLFDRLG
ncbi:uncharacterized protein LOC122384783 [Amphibalanus amphitrite]|uniref:uncharacterized protein LOC122384783 n=1 Tax=Amphibalanus amphitrite TaxID=1232801 RepID=UPI001C91DDCB|nr:uncharacterized protein LOC122384783 [Amphibalanus amphitrite]